MNPRDPDDKPASVSELIRNTGPGLDGTYKGSEFSDITLALTVVGDSCIVTDKTTGEMTTNGRDVLAGLASVEVPGGVSATVWLTACTDVARSTFFYWRHRLLVQDLVCTIGTGRNSRYTLSEQGKQWLKK